jgi:UPF0176 protein
MTAAANRNAKREESELPIQIAAFYRFAPLPDCREIQPGMQDHCRSSGLLGTILLAEEGINGTVAGSPEAVAGLFGFLARDDRLQRLEYKVSWAAEQPFHRMKVRVKNEIVSMGVGGVDPTRTVGQYVSPEDWNALIDRPDVRVIDTRNDYEHLLGSFEGAEDPGTRSFRDFPDWASAHLDPASDQHVAMFCTGGIRCEKATSWLKDQGFANVYHLDGGILAYLEKVAPEDSKWRGDCFVFDNRVTVDHALQQGDFEVCPACRMPLTEADRNAPEYEENVSCPRCFDRLTESRREGLLERARQIELARARGERHLGAVQPVPEDGERPDRGGSPPA